MQTFFCKNKKSGYRSSRQSTVAISGVVDNLLQKKNRKSEKIEFEKN